jgi:hypothetical protein
MTIKVVKVSGLDSRHRESPTGRIFFLPRSSPHAARVVKTIPERGIMPNTNICLQ